MTVKREKVINSAIAEIEELDRADAALESGDDAKARRAVEKARELRLKAAPPVPVSVAARMLEVSEPTIRDWADRGLLEDTTPQTRPRAFSPTTQSPPIGSFVPTSGRSSTRSRRT